jgi:putative ABC transport system permease protein
VSILYRIAGLFPSFVIARRNISRAKTRSALAALAVVIGVVAIGAVGGGSVAFKQSIFGTIEEQGANNVFVSPGFDREQRFFDQEDIRQIEATVDTAGVVGTSSQSAEYRVRAGEMKDVSVTYTEDPRVLYEVGIGELPTNWRNSVVVSNEFATEHRLRVGDRVTIEIEEETPAGTVQTTETYRVSAILAPTARFGVSQLFLPMEQLPERRYDQIQITTRNVDRAEAVAAELDEEFNGRKSMLFVLELTSLVRFIKNIANSLNLFLVGLGSISLLVSGVAIANTMLMAVIKRREEIGVLRAVGYQRGDVLRVLLVESGMLGLIGTTVGMVIAVGVTVAANAIFLGNPLAFSGEALFYLGGAAAFGVLISLVAGVYPAWRAANERPVDALRG